ncbi:hypothetical protein BGX29_003236 [Mortierella sp. GBA35]|nr:hypothetical protein BGX29_003236 [Mortierella sp. GBA35]
MSGTDIIHAQQIFNMVDILHLLARFLSPPDLFACTQVSRLWNSMFIPYLWETIDDTLCSWSRILALYDTEEGRAHGHDEHWARGIFAKYGRHIRNLSLCWRVLIDAASEAQCSNLRFLRTTDIKETLTWKEKVERDQIRELHRTGRDEDRQWDPATLSVEGAFISPEFEGVLEPSEKRFRPTELQVRDWTTLQNFWTMVRRNPRLCSLTTSHGLGALARVASGDFIQGIVDGLPELTVLTYYFEIGDPFVLLARLPQLRTFTIAEWGDFKPSATFGNLKALTLYVLLKHLPGLESLTIKGNSREFFSDPAVIMDTTSQLKRFVLSGFERVRHVANDTRMADAVLPWIPHLRHIEFFSITAWSAQAIVKYCPQIESVVQTRDDFTLFAKVALQPGHQFNNYSCFLRDCSALRVLTGSRQKLLVDEIVNYPWSCDRLESLGCQIGGLERLTEEGEGLLARLSAREDGAGLSNEELGVVQRHERCQEQHQQVYGRLATLTHLTALDLSHELRSVRLNDADRHSARHGHTQTPGSRHSLIRDCLELSLKSGLVQLAPLVNLEMIGFLGIDHRIGKSELTWMAKAWPRLKTMRGLTDDHEPRNDHDERKTELREYMMMLRPDITHESIVSSIDLN